MTLKELANNMLAGKIKIVCARTGRVLMHNAQVSKNVSRYGELEVCSLYLSLETTGHLKDFVRPVLVAYAYSNDYNAIKNKEE